MIQNLRDLGGIRNQEGKSIRKGMLIRSAHLFQAEEKDLKGIATIIDLRTPGERKEGPDRSHGREYLPMPIFDDVQAGISHESGTEEHLIPDMAILYRRLVTECADSFREVMLTILRHDYSSGAVLWHCTEGKDRCGLTSALVLEVLGVDRSVIMEDYLKTNLINLPKAIRMRERVAASHGEAFAASVYQAYIADERYLREAWDAMEKDYLRETLQIPEELLQRFQRTILE